MVYNVVWIMGKLCRISVVVALVCACAGGCADLFSGGSRPRPHDDSDSIAVYYDGIPRVRPGVLIAAQVGAPSQQPVSMQVQVDQCGDATFPYLLKEPVKCNGKTLDELKQILVAQYREYIREPVVTVSFIPVSGNEGVSPYGTVNVLGEVAMPGPVNMPATMDLTVTKVIKLAGGLRPFADKSKIRVTSCDRAGNKYRTIVNLQEIGKNGDISKDIALRAGDVVWVPESWY